jgi:outer membrane protein assembly factor BamA
VEDDLGFSADWGLTLSGRSTVNASYNWSVLEPDSNASTTERDYRQGVNLGLTRNINQDASLSIVLRFNKRRSGDISRQYEEYGAGISFNQSF